VDPRLLLLAQARILDNITEGVSITDEHGCIRYTNPAEDRMFGYEPGEMTGKHIAIQHAYEPEENQRRVEEMLAELRKSGAWAGEWRNRRKSGEVFFTFVRASALDAGGLQHWLFVQEDITERRRAESDLRSAHEFLNSLVHSSPLPIIVFDTAGALTLWNPAAERVFGWRAEEVLGKRIPFVPAEKAAEHRSMRAQDLSGRGFTDREIRRQRKDGTPLELLVSTVPLKNAGGEVSAVMSMYVDITDRKRAEISLRETERELRLVTDEAPVYLAHCDKEARFNFVNRRYAERFHLTPGDIIGKRIPEVIGEQAYQQLRPYVEAALAGERVQFEVEAPYDELGRRLIRCSYVPEFDAAGEPVGLIAAISDVTEERRGERERRLLVEVIDNSPDFIGIAAPDQRVVFVNRAGQALLGLDDPHDVRAKRLIDFFPEDDRANIEQAVIPQLLERGSWDGEVRFRDFRTGEPIPMLWNVFTIPDAAAAGGISGIAFVARNITDRKRFEEEMRQTQKLESLGVLAGGIAHDFNNLLAGIMGSASLAVDLLDREHAARPLLEVILDASERAAHLTRQMLAYSGKGAFVMQTVDLNAFVRDALPLLQLSIPKNVQLRVEEKADFPYIQGDPGQLQQILMNLVINGAEAIGSELNGEVLVRTGAYLTRLEEAIATVAGQLPAGRYITLEVRDTGSGMDEATRRKIFDPFFSTKFTGRGLGLSAVLGIVRAHHGALTVDSTPGEGSSFLVYFPAVDAGADATAGAAAGVSGSGLVLVVDDEAIVRRTAKSMLERLGYTVLQAEHGEQALDILRERGGDVDFVLLDWMMPRMNGEQTLAKIRQLSADVRVILCSGYTETEAMRRFAGKGLAGFLQKPYRPADLARKIAEARRTAPPQAAPPSQ
jgi:PAS domain S-box-containing protein